MCTIKGCRESAVAGGLCARHYMRVRRHGSPDAVLKPGPKPDPAKAAAKPSRTARPVDQDADVAVVGGIESQFVEGLQRRIRELEAARAAGMTRGEIINVVMIALDDSAMICDIFERYKTDPVDQVIEALTIADLLFATNWDQETDPAVCNKIERMISKLVQAVRDVRELSLWARRTKTSKTRKTAARDTVTVVEAAPIPRRASRKQTKTSVKRTKANR